MEKSNGYIEMMKAEGWKVYKRGKGEYCFVTDGTRIAYVQWSHSEPKVSTVHKPNHTTGTGFSFAESITPEIISRAMSCIAPSWAKNSEIESVKKYRDWNEFHNENSWNQGLKEVEL